MFLSNNIPYLRIYYVMYTCVKSALVFASRLCGSRVPLPTKKLHSRAFAENEKKKTDRTGGPRTTGHYYYTCFLLHFVPFRCSANNIVQVRLWVHATSNRISQ